jgi:hypothetical protein
MQRSLGRRTKAEGKARETGIQAAVTVGTHRIFMLAKNC